MIKVLSIEVHEFRGIRDFSIDFAGENFAICGRNGTGKSGIVDALEFGLTGNVSRLSGRGTGDISLKDHGPHVDSRNRPDKARVKLTVKVANVEAPVTIERSVDNPQSPTITPSTSGVLKPYGKSRCIQSLPCRGENSFVMCSQLPVIVQRRSRLSCGSMRSIVCAPSCKGSRTVAREP